jgi:hypothetical protein
LPFNLELEFKPQYYNQKKGEEGGGRGRRRRRREKEGEGMWGMKMRS